MLNARDLLEKHQISIYLGSVLLAIVTTALGLSDSNVLERGITPAVEERIICDFERMTCD